MFIRKYSPKSLKEFVNQKEAVQKFLNYVENFDPKQKKALMLFGPPGTGKTCLVYAYCLEHKRDLIEINASDVRTSQKINEIIGNAMNTLSLTGRKKLILIDEVDGISAKEDRGGLSAIIKIIQNSNWPVILTANDAYDEKIKLLRYYCELVEFKKLSKTDIVKKLKEICESEKINYDIKVLEELAERSEGDLRAAINDLEVISRGKNKIELKDLEVLGSRDREKNIFQALGTLFKTTSLNVAKLSFLNVDLDPDSIFSWIEENVCNEYEKIEEIEKAYEYLSKADIFRSRIYNRNYWKLLKYFNDLMLIGVALAKKEPYKKFVKYKFPQKISYLSKTLEERKEIKEKLKELSKTLNCSTKKVKSEYLPYLNKWLNLQ